MSGFPTGTVTRGTYDSVEAGPGMCGAGVVSTASVGLKVVGHIPCNARTPGHGGRLGLRMAPAGPAGLPARPEGLGIFHLGHHTALLADLRMLAALPRFGTMFDLSSGIAVAF